jgi:hypothetical protein
VETKNFLGVFSLIINFKNIAKFTDENKDMLPFAKILIKDKKITTSTVKTGYLK